jgi:ABC-type multidrug transport system fused ATPase/permease subunit
MSITTEFRNISYTYPGSKEPALKNISFTLEAGETLAIVGCNGSGKNSSLFHFERVCKSA